MSSGLFVFIRKGFANQTIQRDGFQLLPSGMARLQALWEWQQKKKEEKTCSTKTDQKITKSKQKLESADKSRSQPSYMRPTLAVSCGYIIHSGFRLYVVDTTVLISLVF